MIAEYLKTQQKLYGCLHCLAGEVGIIVVSEEGLPQFLALTSVNAFITSVNLIQ